MGDGCSTWFAIPIHHLLQVSRAATAYDAQLKSRRMLFTCHIFQALTNSAFLIRRAVMRHCITARLGKQRGALPAISLQQSLRITPIARRWQRHSRATRQLRWGI